MTIDKHSALTDAATFAPPKSDTNSNLTPITSSADNQAHAQITKTSESSPAFTQFPSKDQLLQQLGTNTQEALKDVPNIPQIQQEQQYINSGRDPNALQDQQRLNQEIKQADDQTVAESKADAKAINHLSTSDLKKIGSLVTDMQDGNVDAIKKFVEGYKKNPSALNNLLVNDGNAFGLALQLNHDDNLATSEGYSYNKQGKMSALSLGYGTGGKDWHEVSTNS